MARRQNSGDRAAALNRPVTLAPYKDTFVTYFGPFSGSYPTSRGGFIGTSSLRAAVGGARRSTLITSRAAWPAVRPPGSACEPSSAAKLVTCKVVEVALRLAGR
jgi:hypothetical protein